MVDIRVTMRNSFPFESIAMNRHEQREKKNEIMIFYLSVNARQRKKTKKKMCAYIVAVSKSVENKQLSS